MVSTGRTLRDHIRHDIDCKNSYPGSLDLYCKIFLPITGVALPDLTHSSRCISPSEPSDSPCSFRRKVWSAKVASLHYIDQLWYPSVLQCTWRNNTLPALYPFSFPRTTAVHCPRLPVPWSIFSVVSFPRLPWPTVRSHNSMIMRYPLACVVATLY